MDCCHVRRRHNRSLVRPRRRRESGPGAPQHSVVRSYVQRIGRRPCRPEDIAHLRQVRRQHIDLGVCQLGDAVHHPVAVTARVPERELGDRLPNIRIGHCEQGRCRNRRLAVRRSDVAVVGDHGRRRIDKRLGRELSPAAPGRAVIGPYEQRIGRTARTEHVAHLRQVRRGNIDLLVGSLGDAVDSPVSVTLRVPERILGDDIAIGVRDAEEGGGQHGALTKDCRDIGCRRNRRVICMRRDQSAGTARVHADAEPHSGCLIELQTVGRTTLRDPQDIAREQGRRAAGRESDAGQIDAVAQHQPADRSGRHRRAVNLELPAGTAEGDAAARDASRLQFNLAAGNRDRPRGAARRYQLDTSGEHPDVVRHRAGNIEHTAARNTDERR